MYPDKLLEDLLKNPLALLAIKDSKLIAKMNSFIPYSTGFEIECYKAETYDEKAFENIPDIMEVNNDGYEQRYRIPNGIRGIICLKNISHQLCINSMLNYGSGIHYHVDLEETYNNSLRYNVAVPKGINHTSIAVDNKQWILKELDSWGYKGAYNKREFGGWYRYNSLGTIEFRCGEMTFDYDELLRNIIHANSIVRRLKAIYREEDVEPDYLPITVEWGKQQIVYQKSLLMSITPLQKKIQALNSKLAKIQSEIEPEKPKISPLEAVRNQVRKREHRINKPNNNG